MPAARQPGARIRFYISQEPNQQLAPTLQPNGTGGALVMWTDCRNYPAVNSCYANSDVYAQDVDASGNSLWQLNGYPLLVDPGNQGEQYLCLYPCASDGFRASSVRRHFSGVARRKE